MMTPDEYTTLSAHVESTLAAYLNAASNYAVDLTERHALDACKQEYRDACDALDDALHATMVALATQRTAADGDARALVRQRRTHR